MSVPVIRLFVSSTFDDFWVEREALQSSVFPVLEELCQAEGMQFRAIDLRWGVSPTESARHDTIDICLDELRRCQRMSPKPNFMVMLGDRFGWQPPLPTIPEERFQALLAAIPDDAERAFIASCYPAELKDDNAIPPLRRLRTLTGAAGFGSERRIRDILGRYYRHANGSMLEKHWFQLSATGLEIAVGVLDPDLPGEAVDNVWCLERSILAMPASQEAGRYRDIHEGAPDVDSAALLCSLKQQLRDAVAPHHYFQYEERWIGGGAPAQLQALAPDDRDRAELLGLLGHARYEAYARRWTGGVDGAPAFPGLNPEITHDRIREVCDRTLAALARVVQRRIAEVRAVPPHVREDLAHQGFQAAVADGIAPGSEGQRFLSDYLGGAGDAPYLLVLGPRGSGKTSALASALSRHAAGGHAQRIVARYLGVTSTSGNVRALLHGIMQNLGYAHPSVHTPQMVRRQLQEALDRETVILAIDGVDRLAPRELRWLLASFPTRLRNGSRIIVSASPGRAEEIEDADSALPWKQWILPQLEDEAAEKAIVWRFGRHALARRTLQPRQLACILEGFRGAGRLPLYLSVATVLARSWTSDHIAALPANLDALVAQYIAMLDKHGPALVKAALGLFAMSRAGLSEQEIVDLLSNDEAVMAECRSNYPKEAGRLQRLPDMIWSRLYTDLASFCYEAESGGARVLRLADGRFAEAVLGHVIRHDDPGARRRQIARYFEARLTALEGQDGGRTPDLSCRRIDVELPYQLSQSASFERLADLLSSPGALARMCNPHTFKADTGYSADSMFAELCLYWAELRNRGYRPAQYLSRTLDTVADPAVLAVLEWRINRLLTEIGEVPIGSRALES